MSSMEGGCTYSEDIANVCHYRKAVVDSAAVKQLTSVDVVENAAHQNHVMQ